MSRLLIDSRRPRRPVLRRPSPARARTPRRRSSRPRRRRRRSSRRIRWHLDLSTGGRVVDPASPRRRAQPCRADQDADPPGLLQRPHLPPGDRGLHGPGRRPDRQRHRRLRRCPTSMPRSTACRTSAARSRMARAQDPNSANSQFYIMFVPRLSMDRNYTVFGRVVSGMNFVDAIERGEPPASPTRIVRASIGSDNVPPMTAEQLRAEAARLAAAAAPARRRAGGQRRRPGRAAAAGRAAPARAGPRARARRPAPRPQRVRVDLFDFELPPDRIALRPASPRDCARLLLVAGGAISDHVVARSAAAAARAATCWSSTTPGSSPPSSKGGAARRGSARPCTSARGRAPGAPSSATPSGCARATGSISAPASPRIAERARRGRLLPARPSKATSRSSCCSSAPAGCRCRPISPAGARPTRATATITRPCSRARKARSRRRPPRSISRRG